MESTFLTLGISLILVGFLLMFAELFIPSGGILSVLSLGSLIVGVVFTFKHDTSAGLAALLSVGVGVPVVGSLLLYLWPRTPMGRRLFLPPSPEDDTLATVPIIAELDRLKGRIGKSLSPLRPAGVVDFDGKRIDSLTDGRMVDVGQWVRCVDVRAGKVVVQPIERPNLGELETAIFT